MFSKISLLEYIFYYLLINNKLIFNINYLKFITFLVSLLLFSKWLKFSYFSKKNVISSLLNLIKLSLI